MITPAQSQQNGCIFISENIQTMPQGLFSYSEAQ